MEEKMERRKKIGGKGGMVREVNDGGDEKFLKQRIREGEERGRKRKKGQYYHNVNTACTLQYVTN